MPSHHENFNGDNHTAVALTTPDHQVWLVCADWVTSMMITATAALGPCFLIYSSRWKATVLLVLCMAFTFTIIFYPSSITKDIAQVSTFGECNNTSSTFPDALLHSWGCHGITVVLNFVFWFLTDYFYGMIGPALLLSILYTRGAALQQWFCKTGSNILNMPYQAWMSAFTHISSMVDVLTQNAATLVENSSLPTDDLTGNMLISQVGGMDVPQSKEQYKVNPKTFETSLSSTGVDYHGRRLNCPCEARFFAWPCPVPGPLFW